MPTFSCIDNIPFRWFLHNSLAPDQDAKFSSYDGIYKCIDRDTMEATDFLFNFTSAQTPTSTRCK